MATSEERDEQRAFDANLITDLRGVAQSTATAVVVVALLVLVGWVFNIEVLRSVIPGLTAMNPGGSALAYLLAGGSLWILSGKELNAQQIRIARAMATVVVVLALARLVLYAIGLEWGPDQWLFRAKLDLYHPPNRMAPNTALGLLLVGLGLLVLDVETRHGHRPAQWLALAASFLSLFALVGYLCNTAILIGLQSYIPMALNSAIALAMLVLGILFARPDQGLMAVVTHRETGGFLARRLLPASILSPAAFASLAAVGQRAGLFEPTFGVSLFVVSTIVFFVVLVWWSAQLLNRIDAERTRTQRELHKKGAILKSVLNSMGDGVVVADQDGRFMIFNPAAERILGRGAIEAPPPEWTGQYGLFSVETGEPLNPDDIPLVRAIRGESTNQLEMIVKNPQHPEGVQISVTGRPLKGEAGVDGGVVVFQDSTQRRRAEEAIRRARDEAEASNRAKSEFLANMSHEIRTPMNAVIGMTELVLDSELTDVQRMYLKIVKDSAESLLSLINDILDFSKIEAGKMELDHIQFQIRDLLGDAMKTLSMRTRGKDLELACHVSPQVPEYMVGDPHRLRQVVTNLLSNSLKFTERGEVVLDVSAEDFSNDQVRIHVKVRDTGIGIPENKLHLLFNAFSQVDASTTRRYGGTGLGLAITARLVQLMNGRTWVESELGKGSTFHFTATFQRDDSPPPPSVAPEVLKNLRILIVDDNETNRLILHEQLSAWGMRPMSLASASDAIDELRRAADALDPFRVVLSDVQMPDVDGFTLASQIRQEDRFGSTVIMMLSSGAGPGDIARCHALGAASHLLKPIKTSELLETIAAVMGKVTHNEVTRESNSDPGRPLNILLVEDSEANQKLAMGVLSKWGHSLTIANNGVDAISAFERGRFDVILMDVQMPEMDGLQATSRIREMEQGDHIPIIAMTANAMKGDREECLLAGMDDYVIKPIRWPELRQALDRAMRGTTSMAPHDEVNSIPLSADSTQAGSDRTDAGPLQHQTSVEPVSNADLQEWMLDWDEALRVVDSDEGLLGDVLKGMTEEWPRMLAELHQAIDSNDNIAIKRAVHTIRGSLRMFGISEAVRLAEQIELLTESKNLPAVISLLPVFESQLDDILAEINRRLNRKST